MKDKEFIRRLKRGELEKNQNYIRCLNMSKCGQIVRRDKGIKLEDTEHKDNDLLVESKGFGNLQYKETNLTHSKVCTKRCGYQMTGKEDLNECDNPPCTNKLRMDEVKHDTTPEEAKKIHEEMGHVVEDHTTYYCSEECAIAQEL